ncbi:radical SAM/SPASM domain-containing protein [uncultured Bacteroides sp.]|uniref:radical SAM/SPASM domain-containing protein n=1 Tax=uncultured Bacteroides sp. TaxID=162156 RepID=UPI002AAAABA5|nr:radical SAM protein [uncultured Bacteroides sp.]
MEKLKLSYYTIPVKLESEENKYLLVHGYTGAIDVVDGDVWSQMKNISSDSDLSAEAVLLLQKRGYLTTKNKGEELNYVIRLAHMFHQAQSKLYKSFGFIVSYNCSFRCPYCFENEISNHGNQWSKQVFTKEMVDKAYNAMLEIEPRQKLHFKQILLFGGEPLLRENKKIVEYIVLKGAQLGYTFKVTTNGYDIDYFEDILSPHYFSFVQITLDGNKEHHNARRFHYIEGDSFDKIMTNIGILLKKDINVLVKVNTDNNNFYDFNFLREQFDTLGYTKNPHFELKSSFLRSFNFNADTSDNIDYIPSITTLNKKHKEEYNGEIYSQDFGIYKRFYSYLRNKSRCRLFSASCASHYGSFLFDPMGDIYTCLEIIGKKEYVIGSFLEDNIQWTEVRKHWFEKNVGNSVGCKVCKYALLCGGPCLARIKHTKDGFNSFYCDKFKNIFSISINKAYIAYKNNQSI